MARRSRPTIVDVAGAAGVSKSLVSLVMRGAPNVSDDARAAVLAAASALDYRPNAMARSLAEQRSHVLGLMVSDLTNPFFVDVINGASGAAIGGGYRALVNTGDRHREREVDALETMLRMQADGLIVAAPIVSQDLLERIGSETPTVVTNRGLESKVVDSVVLDDVAGARLAVEHLVALGHRDIAHIDGGPGPGARQRVHGYRAAMEDHGLGAHIRVAEGAYTEDGGVRGALELLAEGLPPTAIIAANDMAALGALETLEARALAVPDVVSVVGFDDIFVAGLRHVGLTSIRQDGRRMGTFAVEMLIERIEHDRTEPRHIVLQPELTVRSTTAPPPAGPKRNLDAV
jgi:DNA-binding LacI/PurR family transcriptional regulator